MGIYKLLRNGISTIALAALLFAFPASSQEASTEDGSIEETARQLNNPVGTVWNIVFQNNYKLLNGDISSKNRGLWLTNFQPVMPLPVTRNWNLIARPILPILSAPVPLTNGNFDRQTGLGDIAFQAFVSPNKTSGLVWGLGPVLGFTTATDNGLGTDKWTAGPAALALYVSQQWVVGALVTQIWSYAGKSRSDDVSIGTLQYFVTRILPGGWQTGLGTPIITANWEADSDDRWTVPVGPSVGRTFRVGKIPLQVSLEASYAVVHPDTFGERWNFRLVLKPVIPALIKKPLFGN